MNLKRLSLSFLLTIALIPIFIAVYMGIEYCNKFVSDKILFIASMATMVIILTAVNYWTCPFLPKNKNKNTNSAS